MRLLSALPGLEAAAELGSDAFRADDLARLGRIRLGEGPHLELIHVPIAAVFAPAWPVLAHGALGVLLVHANPVSGAEERGSGSLSSIPADFG